MSSHQRRVHAAATANNLTGARVDGITFKLITRPGRSDTQRATAAQETTYGSSPTASRRQVDTEHRRAPINTKSIRLQAWELSYTDEAKLRARARQIEHTLRQIQSFQSVQSGLGPV